MVASKRSIARCSGFIWIKEHSSLLWQFREVPQL